MTFLVIGTGAIGKRHAQNLGVLGEEVISVSLQSEGMAGVIRAFENGPEAAIICTATQLRLPIVELAAKYNVPVYIEKPVAYRLSELNALTDVLGDLAHKSFVGFMMRYHPAVQYLIARDCSDIYRFNFEIGHDVNQWRANWSFSQSYASNSDGGGVLLDLCHEVDMAHSIMGSLSLNSVNCVQHPEYTNVDFSTQLSAHTSSATGSIAMDYISPISTRRINLMGTHENIMFDFSNDIYQIHRPDGVETLDLTIDRQKMFQNTMTDFIKLVRGQAPNNPNAPIMAKEHQVCRLICNAYEQRTFNSELKVQS